MALILGDRIKETTTVAGTGTATLLGATTGFQSFAAVGNGNTTYYCIADQGGPNWEVGIGTYSSSGNTLARTTVLASSNAGALVVFTAGVKDVFVTYPAEKGVWYDASGNVLFTGTTTAANLAYTGTLTGGTGILNIGSGQLYKDASGNVGIGTSSPTAVLQIASDATGTDFRSLSTKAGIALNFSGSGISYYDSNTTVFRASTSGGSTERMRIDSSGNVGIGTSSPASYGSPLTVYLAANPTLTIASGNANAYLRLYSTSDASMYLANTGGSMTMVTANTERMRINSSGNLLVGTTSAILTTARLTVATTVSAGIVSATNSNTNLFCVNTNNTSWNAISFRYNTSTEVGHIDCTSTATTYTSGSDYRLKESITPMVGGLDKIMLLNPVDFIWKINNSKGQGFIAHELQEHFPDAVTGEKDALEIYTDKNGIEQSRPKYQGVDPSKIVGALTAAIQELKAIIDTQQEQINSLLGK